MSDDLRVRLALPRADFRLEVDLTLPGRGITVLFGPSGSGKTSVLRCVAGLERARDALVRVDNETWQHDANGLFVPTWQRALGYVFQEASLFEHLDVRGNLRYGMRRTRSPQASHALDAAVELLGIGHLLERPVAQLSGGERQRVAIARALGTGPRLLLLDEPMAALDLARRQDVMPWLEKLRDELRLPMLYVTHSIDELARLADHLVVLEHGRVAGAGPVQEVLVAVRHPALTGEEAGALLHATVAERSAQWQLTRVDFAGGSFWLRDTGLPVGAHVRLRVPAREISLALQAPTATSIQNQLRCVIDSIADDTHASQVLVRLRCGNALLLARVTRRAVAALGLQAGSPVWALVKSVALVGQGPGTAQAPGSELTGR